MEPPIEQATNAPGEKRDVGVSRVGEELFINGRLYRVAYARAGKHDEGDLVTLIPVPPRG